MSIETGVLIDLEGEPIYWHMPEGRSSVYLPDSRPLWDVVWENRNRVLGFAHSHPGRGQPYPSHEDVTTFSAVELALGRRLTWWITSEDVCDEFYWTGPEPLRYTRRSIVLEPPWVDRLRDESYNFWAPHNFEV